MSDGNPAYEVYQDRKGDWRWRMTDGDGRIIGAACEGYPSRADCEANMRRGNVPTDKWEFYKDKRGAIRWRRIAVNGRIVGAATIGFLNRATAEANAAHHGYRPK